MLKIRYTIYNIIYIYMICKCVYTALILCSCIYTAVWEHTTPCVFAVLLGLLLVDVPCVYVLAYITTLHKKGPKQDPANYRISITSCFGKLFTGILNRRLTAFMQDKNISHPFQGAFTKGRRSTDHIFVANTFIDQAKYMGHPLYAAFIDLQKAYNSVNSPLLFRKMIMCGLGPQFCKLVENMYIKAPSRIKLGAKLGANHSPHLWDSDKGTHCHPCYSTCSSQTSFSPSNPTANPQYFTTS